MRDTELLDWCAKLISELQPKAAVPAGSEH
jgi:hypothetical protein